MIALFLAIIAAGVLKKYKGRGYISGRKYFSISFFV